ncbi:Na+/H+ antiporter [Oleoguttula sp. CCFEE 5521]
MSKAEFIDQIRGMDPKVRVQAVEASDAPEVVKKEARKDAREQAAAQRGRGKSVSGNVPVVHERPEAESEAESPGGGGRRREAGNIERADSSDSADLKLVDSNNDQVPFHDLSSTVRNFRHPKPSSSSAKRPTGEDVSPGSETAAQARRRAAAQASAQPSSSNRDNSNIETAAERRRREGALGISKEEDSSDSEEESGEPRQDIGPSTPVVQLAKMHLTVPRGETSRGSHITPASGTSPLNAHGFDQPRWALTLQVDAM